MSEISATLLQDSSSEDLPLSVLLFYTAMCESIALSEFADRLGIGALSLRQFISGQSQRPRSRTLELLSIGLEMPVEELRRRVEWRPASAPRFSEWIKTHMMRNNLSRAKLTRETRISDGALRNYLSGQTLPDSDQAQRLAETLGVDPLALAKVLVADHIVRNGGETMPETDAVQDASAMSFGMHPTSTMAGMFGAEDAGNGFSFGHHVGHATQGVGMLASDEEHVLALWRKLHPQGRRATLIYIAGLLAEE